MAMKVDYIKHLVWNEQTGDFIGPDGRIIHKPEPVTKEEHSLRILLSKFKGKRKKS